ncbi:hypothetical protein BU15DRAFT_64397 [Melanogaster broomeanus]|nr:hypothetical protein BU15DRAFT_64397 [Melanogaster broomeanus]
MSSDLQSVLTGIQLNDYMSVAIAAALAYDYLLTFAQEIEYVWVSPLCGMFQWNFLTTDLDSTDSKSSQGIMLYIIGSWTFLMFLAVANLLMILRVYAMYKRSRIILFILLGIYLPTMVVLVVSASLETPGSSLLVTSAEVIDVKFCVVTGSGIFRIATYAFIPRFVLSVLLCILAIAQFVRQSLQMHAALKKWQSNQYAELLVQENILYFVVNMMFLLSDFRVSVDDSVQDVMVLVSYILPYVLAPRFVISVRELYSHAMGEHSDTGFGVSKNNNTIMFASAGMIAGDVEMTWGTGAGTGAVEGAHGCTDQEGAGMPEGVTDGVVRT